MNPDFRRSALAVLVLLVALPLFAQQVQPWDGPPFSADPKALVDAAKQVEPGDFAIVRLLDEGEYVVDATGVVKSSDRTMVRVVAEAGVQWASEVRASWAPWSSERPSIEARVIAPDGTVHTLDQAAIVEVPAGEENDIFSDGRVLRAPLPAVAIGSIVEYVIHSTSRNAIPGAGTAVHFRFGGYLPTERTRMIIDAPASFTTPIVNTTGLEPRVEERDGRRRSVYESGRIEGEREYEADVPYDVATWRYLAFSTGRSWQDNATRYSAIVDQQIEGNDLAKLVRTAIGNTTDRKEIVTRLLAAIQKDVRYAGVEIGEGSIVPRTPRQVLANKYGDCKDKAALLVAMLRVAGVPAHVALLAAGTGFDVRQELPGLGQFNHAIVVVDGEPAIWVDPTDVFARAGELPLADQGRLALIAKPETTALTPTPETPSTANVYRELRTFVLPEDGKARVTEVTEVSGTSESGLRRWVSGLDAKTLRDDLESYAKSTFVAKTLARYETTTPNDLTKPFRMTLEVPESKSGVAGNGDAEVAINLTTLPSHVPDTLRDWEEVQPGDDPEDAPKKRTQDFLFPQPGVREWVYRIVPPAGYVPRTLLPNETKKLGTTTFTQELHTEADNTVVATFRFDTGKRRLTAEEFQETRVAFTKFVTSNTVTIGFDEIGQTKLNAGDVRGALEEFRRLAALHPKEAQHHIELARALLAGGLGDAAREEIRRAVAIEPKNARAHHMLGTILLNDSLGRAYRRGFDRPGAIAALRKAKELDPQDWATRNALIVALEYGDDGYRFGRGAQLTEAVAEVQSMAKELGDEGKSMLSELTLIYSQMGRFAELRALAPTLDDAQQRDYARIIATAALDGTDAALHELDAFDAQKKRSYAGRIAQTLLQARLYPQAAALMDVSTQGTSAAAAQRQRIDLFKKMKRIEDLPPDDGPGSVFRKLLLALLNHDVEGVKSIFPAEYLTGADEESLREFEEMDLRAPEDFSPLVFADLITMMIETQQDDDGGGGYRVRVRIGGPSESNDTYFFVRKVNGRWLVHGGNLAEDATGHTVLAMAAKGELETARRWLNWTREDAKSGTNDDPLEGAPFAALWPKAKASATVEEIRLGAASLAVKDVASKDSEPILLEARERVESAQAKAAIDVALAKIYEDRDDWLRMLAVTSRLVASHPDSPTAFSMHVEALLRNGKGAEVTTLAQQRLLRLPEDREAVRALSLSAAAAGDYAAAQQYATKIVDELRPKREDLTRAAWVALFTGDKLERAIEHAQRAVKETDHETGVRSLAALAALYAETGKSVEARAALLQNIDTMGNGVLQDGDWYVLGRIAENYGVNDYAITAYRKVSKESGAATVGQLAQHRLDGLVKPKK
jgi:Flp pilus assembly protein TadD